MKVNNLSSRSRGKVILKRAQASNNLLRNKKGGIDVEKVFLIVFVLMILVGLIYVISAAPQAITSVVLNSTSATNLTSENLTAYPSPLNASQKYIYDWKVDGSSIALLNMPFDGEDNNDETITDYSSYGVSVVMGNSGGGDDPTYNATGGYDGKGAFMFTGAKDRLTIVNGQALDNLTNAITVTMWAKLDDYGEDSALYNNWKNDDERWQVYVDSGTKNISFFSEDGDNDDEAFTSNYTFPTGQWVHVAIVGNYRNWKIYANGGLVGEKDVNEGFVDITHTSRHYFGVRRWGTDEIFNREWDGTLDEIMMFGRALSAEQIAAIYNNQTDVIVSQETMQGDSWQACATPNDNIADGTEICSNTLAVENISVALNSTDVSTNYSTDNLTAYVSGLISGDKAIYDWKVDGSSIMALNMPFDGGALCGVGNNLTCDYSSYGYNGTVAGATYNSTGGYGGKGAYYFDGSNDLIKVVSMSGSNIPTDDFTYMAWINMDTNTDETIFMAADGSGGNELGFYVADGKLSININDLTGVVTGAITLNTGQWYHVALTRNSGEVKIYVGGVVDDTGTQSSTLNFGSCSLYFGVDIDSGCTGSKTNYFKGHIDEVLVFDRALSAEQISALYNNRTDLIVSQETFTGEVWEACVTPNNNIRDGTEICSNNISVMGAQIESVVLNSSSGNDYTSDNLTAFPINIMPSGAKAIYNWKKNGDSIAQLIFPFDAGKIVQGGSAYKDYSGNGNNISSGSGNWIYDPTGGYDGKGCNGIITGTETSWQASTNNVLIHGNSPRTVSFWA